MRLIFAAMLAVAFAGEAFAGNIALPMPDNADTILYSEKGPLRLKSFGTEDTANFMGVIELSGTYYYGDNDFNDSGKFDPTVYLLVDHPTSLRLPKFQLRGQPNSIYVTNPEQFARTVIPAHLLQTFAKSKSEKYLSGHFDILVDQFQAGIECDAPYFNAHFLRVAHPPVTVALANLPDIGC